MKRLYKPIIDFVKANEWTQWVLCWSIVIVLNLIFLALCSFTFHISLTASSSFIYDFFAMILIIVLLSLFIWCVKGSNAKVYSPLAILLTIPNLLIMTPSLVALSDSKKLPDTVSYIQYYIESSVVFGQILWIALILQILAYFFYVRSLLVFSYFIITITYVVHWSYLLYWGSNFS